jgi:hypothetical protein
MSARGLKPITVLAANRDHGDRLRYAAGCRCDDCRRANTAYERARNVARKAGDWNGIVPAARARQHLIQLSRKGVGRRAVQECTDIADSILSAIKSEKRKQIRARTERLILAVTPDQKSGNVRTSAADTWKLINKLLAKGYTKTQIAHGIGAESHALQVGKKKVTVRNAHKVSKFFAKCEAREFSDAARKKLEQPLPAGTYSPKPGVLIHRMGDE